MPDLQLDGEGRTATDLPRKVKEAAAAYLQMDLVSLNSTSSKTSANYALLKMRRMDEFSVNIYVCYQACLSAASTSTRYCDISGLLNQVTILVVALLQPA